MASCGAEDGVSEGLFFYVERELAVCYNSVRYTGTINKRGRAVVPVCSSYCRYVRPSRSMHSLASMSVQNRSTDPCATLRRSSSFIPVYLSLFRHLFGSVSPQQIHRQLAEDCSTPLMSSHESVALGCSDRVPSSIAPFTRCIVWQIGLCCIHNARVGQIVLCLK